METSYKEKYEQALAKAKEQYNYPCMRSCMGILEEIFPELAMSEDEKIKERITLCLEECVHSDVIRDYEKDECAAWLEKQKGNICGISPNSAWSEEDEQHVNSLLKRLEGMCKKGATYTATRFAVSQDIDWLKSLKERKGGKI